MEKIEIFTKSDNETRKFGALFAKEILRKKNKKGATVVSLEGDLGAGKTTFTQGFAKGLGIREVPRSPTFVIMQIYRINKFNRSTKFVKHKNLIHIDAYRISAKDLNVLGWHEFIKNKNNIILVEWGNKIKNILPKDSLRTIFKHIGHHQQRLIKIGY